MSDNNQSSGGIGLAGVLFVVFLVLKLTHVIDWSWWWVTAPLWAGVAFAVVIFLAAGLLAGIAATIGHLADKRRRRRRAAQQRQDW